MAGEEEISKERRAELRKHPMRITLAEKRILVREKKARDRERKRKQHAKLLRGMNVERARAAAERDGEKNGVRVVSKADTVSTRERLQELWERARGKLANDPLMTMPAVKEKDDDKEERLREIWNKLEAGRIVMGRRKVKGNVDPEAWTKDGRFSIMVVGEGPGRQESKEGFAFVGPSGEKLDEILDKTGHSFFISNVLRIRPVDPNTGRDRQPSPEEVERHGWILQEEIAIIQPAIIIAVGSTAAAYLESKFDMAETARKLEEGIDIMSRTGETQMIETPHAQFTLMIMFHPSHALRKGWALFSGMIESLTTRIKRVIAARKENITSLLAFTRK